MITWKKTRTGAAADLGHGLFLNVTADLAYAPGMALRYTVKVNGQALEGQSDSVEDGKRRAEAAVRDAVAAWSALVETP